MHAPSATLLSRTPYAQRTYEHDCSPDRPTWADAEEMGDAIKLMKWLNWQ
jgi:hypothetical protein